MASPDFRPFAPRVADFRVVCPHHGAVTLRPVAHHFAMDCTHGHATIQPDCGCKFILHHEGVIHEPKR